MDNKKIGFIGIAGSSCSGKSSLTSILMTRPFFQASAIVPLDAYYKDFSNISLEKRDAVNFDTPDSLDFPLLMQQLKDLQKGRAVQRPVYLFDLHIRSSQRIAIIPKNFVFVEGLFSLYWNDLKEFLDLSIFIQIDNDLSLYRRLKRDQEERNRSSVSIKEQFKNTVLPMKERFIEPTKECADLILDGSASLLQNGSIVEEFIRERWE